MNLVEYSLISTKFWIGQLSITFHLLYIQWQWQISKLW